MLTTGRKVAAAVGGLLVMLAIATPSFAADGDAPVDVHPIGGGRGGTGGGADVDIGIGDPGEGGTTAKPVADKPKRKGGTSRCSFVGKPVDCTSPGWGTWYAPQQCWIRVMSPQPAKDDPVWSGQSGGAIFWCQPPSTGGSVGGGHMLWLPGRATVDLVDPAVLAQRAVDRMRLVGARVGATPLHGGEGIVGLQTWLWVANDGPTSMGPISRTVTAGSVSVTATAHVTDVVWAMGNGDVARCRTAGTVWRAGVRGSTGDSPTCGYTYLHDSGDQPGHAYTITPTTHWRVEWNGGGQSGVITFTIDGGQRAMPVVELQTVRVG